MWERSMSSRIVPESMAGIIPQRPEARKSPSQAGLRLGTKKPSLRLGIADVIGTERAGFEPAEAFTSLVLETRSSTEPILSLETCRNHPAASGSLQSGLVILRPVGSLKPRAAQCF